MKHFYHILFRLLIGAAAFVPLLTGLALLWRTPPQGVVVQDLPVKKSDRPESPGNPLWGLFHPAWRNPRIDKLKPIISDPLGRTDAGFQVSQRLRGRVLFWTAIYGIFESRHRVLHDRIHPDLIYGHIDLSSIESHFSAVRFQQTATQVEKSIQMKLARWLVSIADGTDFNSVPLEETIAFRHFLMARGYDSPQSWKLLANSLRSQSGQQDVFLKALSRSRKLLPDIELTFSQFGLPKHAARIPFVESSFHPKAFSKTGAMGIWQFMPIAAKDWISKTNRLLWTDPAEQTVGAAKMLVSFKKKLPDWGTAITAYNSGVGRMTRLVLKYEANSLEDILEQDEASNGLGFAGENFYAEVLAATLVEAYKTEIFSVDVLEGFLALKANDEQPYPGFCTDQDSLITGESAHRPLASAAAAPGQDLIDWIGSRWMARFRKEL